MYSHGARPHDALPVCYQAADLFLFASETETQGLVLAEALAAGTRVVAIDTPQARDVLGGCGTLAENNATTLADTFDKLAADGASKEDREAVRSAATRFGAGLQTERTLSLYRELLARETALAT